VKLKNIFEINRLCSESFYQKYLILYNDVGSECLSGICGKMLEEFATHSQITAILA